MKMLEYTKTILRKVSFDRTLFEKELQKALALLDAKEIAQLKVWLMKNFTAEYSEIIEEYFHYEQKVM
ncbi:MAG: hypothetical protein SNJ71_07490 [Bacteroidales bacterium]